MENNEFINIYIQNLANEVSELSKMKVLLVSKESFKEAENNELRKKIVELEKEKVTIKEEKEQALEQKLLDVQRTLEGKNTILATRISELHSTIEEKDKEIYELKKLGTEEKLNSKSFQKPKKQKPQPSVI